MYIDSPRHHLGCKKDWHLFMSKPLSYASKINFSYAAESIGDSHVFVRRC